MSSMGEYDGTLRLPYEFKFEDGPLMQRHPIVHIEGGAVVWVWKSESGATIMTYRVPANMGEDYIGRGVSLSCKGAIVPPEGYIALAKKHFPDEATTAMGMEGDDPPTSFGLVMMPKPLRAMSAEPRFPGWN